MDPGGFLTHLASRLRLSAIAPALAMGVEGEARLCTFDHDAPMILPGPPIPRAPLHLDVEVKLWNRGVQSFTVFEVRNPRAAGQSVVPVPTGYRGALREVTLESSGNREQDSFRLNAPDGTELVAKPGDLLTFKFRTSRPGRWRRVELEFQVTS